MFNIHKKAYVILTVFTLSILLSGCDEIFDVVRTQSEKGTLDGVIRCMEENQHKEKILSKKFIENSCIRKHEKETYEDGFENCLADVSFKSGKGFVTNSECINVGDNLITSVTTSINISNLPKKEKGKAKSSSSAKIYGTDDEVQTPPGEILFFHTVGAIKEDLKEIVENDLPWCSDLKEGEKKTCKSWSITSHKFIKLNF